MAIQLPTIFQERMQSLLKEQYPHFIKSYDQAPHGGLRVNTLKISKEHMMDITPFTLRPIPWCPTGFYTEHGARPGKHPFYHAGLYYIQEPSAMAPVELLNVQPGESVLDLCAAPGGKSTQIAAKLQGKGLLVSNDLNAERTKALAKNLELYGVRNGIVLNEHPDRIAERFPMFFDKILIDAPCSGEGMFRKDEDMVKSWNTDSPFKYADMQRNILRAAAFMLKPGGRIVYSTCTFSPEENEGMIAEFISAHSEFQVVPTGGTGSFAKGEISWVDEQSEQKTGTDTVPQDVWKQVEGTARLWPHLVEGEGHFMAVLQHNGVGAENSTSYESEPLYMRSSPVREASKRDKSGKDRRDERIMSNSGGKGKSKASVGKRGKHEEVDGDQLAAYEQFVREMLTFKPQGNLILFGNHIYVSPVHESRLQGLKVIRPGWYMGEAKNGRFIPGHPFACALHPQEFKRVINLSIEQGEAVKYLKGETLNIERERVQCSPETEAKGYALICIEGYSAGWAKWQDGMLKNEYPAGWRWTSV
ncbi:RsmB/NOP family class I SAM-dependent RNA methyltransferase [Paenibacillus pini]|uniref:tRNA and rRNA cytosine-C5-methylases n=1 Tax=Paenibacillus pini JCM 16418 TaxID=1236976 RepID=W7Y6H8_9BACL|nr:RsmB/NOP family class I SAM-dependent RNA methyltransferase [Paenibacillus pini]GAF06505.1 tRNA and rRNA cytosine-C5-methylases [Paenibacillus pini JCM 16418]